MLICDGCGTVWKARLNACHTCRGPLRPFGSHPEDRRHPLAGTVPIRVDRDPTGDPVAVGGEAGVRAQRPSPRDPVDVWRTWAVSTGVDPVVAGHMTKKQCQKIPDLEAA